MIKKYVFLSILIFPVISISTDAQKVFRDGYIEKKSGERFNGLIEYSVKQGVPSICKFKHFDIANEVLYTANDIKAFGYRNGNRYESRKLNSKTSFYEVLASGKIVVYAKGSEFYIEKDNSGLTSINKVPVSYMTGGREVKYKTLNEFLEYITEGKTKIPAKVSLKNDLVPLIAEFNRKEGEGSQVFNRTMKVVAVEKIALASGSHMNIIGVFSGAGGYILDMKKLAGDYIPAPATEYCPVFGLSYERILSRRSDKLSFIAEVMGFRQTFYAYSEGKSYLGTIRNDAFYDFTAIKIPIMLRYSVRGKKIVPFVNVGVAGQFLIDHNFRHIEEIENSIHEITTFEFEDFTFNPIGINIIAGIGVKTRLYNNIFINIQGRAEYGGCLFKDTSETEEQFKGSSIQPSIILGITF